MKRYLLIILALLIPACASTGNNAKLTALENRVSELEMMLGAGVGANFYPVSQGFTGGGTGVLDKITGTNDDDAAFVVLNDDGTYGNFAGVYSMDTNGGSGDLVPSYVEGGDGGTERWELSDLWASNLKAENSAAGGHLRLYEDQDNGTDYMQWKADDDVGTNRLIGLSSSVANSEDMTIQLGANDNTLTIASTTGVTQLGFSALNLVTTGTIQGAITINADSDGMSQGEMTAVGMYGAVFYATGAGTWNLPAAAAGMSFCLYSTTQAAVIINPDDADVLVYDGVADTAGHQIAAPNATVGEFICFIARDTTNWYQFGKNGTWVPGS